MHTPVRELDAPTSSPPDQEPTPRGKVRKLTQRERDVRYLKRAGRPHDDRALFRRSCLRRLLTERPREAKKPPEAPSTGVSSNGNHGRERRPSSRRRTRASSPSRGDPHDAEPRSCQGCGGPCKTNERTCGACRQREHAERKRLAEQVGAETIAELRAAIWTLEALSGNGRGRDQLATLRGQLAAAEREREQLPPALKLCSCPEPIAAHDGTDPACFRCGRFTAWPTGNAAFDRRPHLSSPLGRINTLVPPRSEKRLRTRLASDKRPSITRARPISAEQFAARYNGAGARGAPVVEEAAR